MLSEITSSVLRKNKIKFHSGLNVVIGDENGSNSIGKSSLLLIIDFVFGGNDFIDRNPNTINELGHHIYFFTLKFSDKQYYFSRSTNESDIVNIYDKEDKLIDSWKLKEYLQFLKLQYKLESSESTWRGLVSLYSRIWGKDNINIKMPLHVATQKSYESCIEDLIKSFNKFTPIQIESKKLKENSEKKTSFSKAYKSNILNKINSTQYSNNEKKITEINAEISDIKNNLAKYAYSINQIVNKKNIELKRDRDHLFETKTYIENKIDRIKNNLLNSKYIKSKNFESLKDFFPDLNLERLDSIEKFHTKISKILKEEIKEAETELLSQLNEINQQIAKIDNSIRLDLESLENPGIIIDRVSELSEKFNQLHRENHYYKQEKKILDELKSTEENLEETKKRILSSIEEKINKTMRYIVTQLYDEERLSPKISIEPNKYNFEVTKDTGTGKAYSNLIVFDLSILKLTKLPIIIHDSLLFKNIQNTAITNLISLYSKEERQIFISIDEVKKYGNKAIKIIHKHKVIELDNKNLLFTKDWRA